MWRNFRHISIFLLLGVAQTAVADSDGYFCASAHYLAFQINSPGVRNAHKFFIVPFESSHNDLKLYEITLPDFQVHAMSCDESDVSLIGWSSMHTVHWDETNFSSLSAVAKPKEPGPTDLADYPQFWNFVFDAHRKFEFASSDEKLLYLLEMRRKPLEELECHDMVTATLHKKRYGMGSQSRILYAREVPRECGG